MTLLAGMGASNTEPDLGVEGLLGFADDTTAVLRDRLDLALRYIVNWYKAIDGSANEDIWREKIDQLRRKVEASERAMDPAKVFPTKAEIAAYEDASANFSSLWRELYLSADTLPDPSLLWQAADYIDTLLELPGHVASTALDSVTRAAKDVLDTASSNLWPYLLVGGLAFGVYTFRAELGLAARSAIRRHAR